MNNNNNNSCILDTAAFWTQLVFVAAFVETLPRVRTFGKASFQKHIITILISEQALAVE